jgi:hypothetical protein
MCSVVQQLTVCMVPYTAVALALGTLCLAAEEAKPDLGTVIGIDLGTTCMSLRPLMHKLHDAIVASCDHLWHYGR